MLPSMQEALSSSASPEKGEGGYKLRIGALANISPILQHTEISMSVSVSYKKPFLVRSDILGCPRDIGVFFKRTIFLEMLTGMFRYTVLLKSVL